MTVAAAILLALTPAAALADPLSCDVSGTLVGEPHLSQADIGACHAFAAIGLVESAIARSKGEKVPLSQADLFVVNTVARREFLDRLIARHKQKAFRPLTVGDFPDGNDPIRDIRAVLANGVARRATVPYPPMRESYRLYREYLISQLVEVERKAAVRSAPERNAADAEIAKLYESNRVLVELTRLILLLHGLPTPSESELTGVADAVLVYLKAQEIAAEYWRVKGAVSERGKQAKFLGPTKLAAIEKERAEVRTKYDFDKMRVVKHKGGVLAPGGGAWIKRQLCVLKRPVAIDVDLHDLPEWNKRGKFPKNAWHAFLLSAVRTDPATGEEFFVVRNSWGLNENHDIAADTLKKTKVRAYTVAAPEENE